ncbi:hypothetical protein SAMN02745172_02434 [Pseudoxanthobacter soli DSM 19599]|uniref:3-methyladenine DNA glycosylase AlkC n=1 Tax=Pseudoxanthobacter soli DSM 19599 TaxID=1123029 RepID=A0A1M7ZLM8_9HYPH|nr:hypothetical protein [Pseudoxanthobacter soli]SHO65787.1 hypothetical protein SAMN02745172_02434 [Pseudoxanthobacter soli DSM 19599]
MPYTLDDKLARIDVCPLSPKHHEIDRNLLHAYIACLTFDELCDAICRRIEAPTPLRLALRGRLLRLLKLSNGEHAERLSRLVDDAEALVWRNHALQARVDALVSAVYSWLPIVKRQDVLERWTDRGTRGAVARWLKASDGDDALFDPAAILAYWRRSLDYRAAKILAYKADPGVLRDIIGELAVHCPEGWIVSRAALRAGSVKDEVWELIRQHQPASFAYLCAMTGRSLTEDEALQLFNKAMPGINSDNSRGLVIWAIGQLGMMSVLDRITLKRDIYIQDEVSAILRIV